MRAPSHCHCKRKSSSTERAANAGAEEHDDFRKTNILSMDKLRKQFDQLEMKKAAAKSVSRHTGFENLDFTAGLTKNDDGSYRA